MKTDKINEIIRIAINEQYNDNVNQKYGEIIDYVRNISRKMNDDDAYELHEMLKKFFNKLI